MDLDRILGIDTSLTDRSWDNRLSNPCQPTPYEALEAVAGRLSPGQHLVDCGCGTGRAVFCLAHTAGCRVTGVEIDARRFAQAEENLRRCARKMPATSQRIRLLHAAAQDVDYAALQPDALYFFNPFPARVLRGVLKRIGTLPDVRLFCYYPDDEWLSLLADAGWVLAESVPLHAALGHDPRERVDIFVREHFAGKQRQNPS